MAVWKILGQDDSTSTGIGSTGRAVFYTNGTATKVLTDSYLTAVKH